MSRSSAGQSSRPLVAIRVRPIEPALGNKMGPEISKSPDAEYLPRVASQHKSSGSGRVAVAKRPAIIWGSSSLLLLITLILPIASFDAQLQSAPSRRAKQAPESARVPRPSQAHYWLQNMFHASWAPIESSLARPRESEADLAATSAFAITRAPHEVIKQSSQSAVIISARPGASLTHPAQHPLELVADFIGNHLPPRTMAAGTKLLTQSARAVHNKLVVAPRVELGSVSMGARYEQDANCSIQTQARVDSERTQAASDDDNQSANQSNVAAASHFSLIEAPKPAPILELDSPASRRMEARPNIKQQRLMTSDMVMSKLDVRKVMDALEQQLDKMAPGAEGTTLENERSLQRRLGGKMGDSLRPSETQRAQILFGSNNRSNPSAMVGRQRRSAQVASLEQGSLMSGEGAAEVSAQYGHESGERLANEHEIISKSSAAEIMPPNIVACETSDEFAEYDHLFLSHDYRCSPMSLIKTQRRSPELPTASALLAADRSSQVRTIYFGGFFPWLADEHALEPAAHSLGSSNRYQEADDDTADAGRHAGRHQFMGANDDDDGDLNSGSAYSYNEMTSGRDEPGADDGQRPSIRRLAKTKTRTAPTTTSSRLKMGEQKKQPLQLPQQQPSLLEGKIGSTNVAPIDGRQQRQELQQDIASASGVSMSTSGGAAMRQRRPAVASTTGMEYTSTETRHQLGKFILPAVRLALDHINTNRSILGNYKLEVVPRDTQCNATISLKQFFDMVYEEPKKMLLYGDACRVSTDPIAKASYFFDLIQISYADTDPIYTIENYPNFFRVVPSENALSLARIPFIRHFNWTRVGTIYQNLPRYSLPHSKLLTDLERFNIVIKQSVSLPGSVDGLQNRDLGDELRKLKDKDVRIILGNFDEEWALLLFCEAYREKMIGRKYQWLLTGFSESKLWRFYEIKGSPCSKQELLVAMDGYIITDITPVTRSQHQTISGMMAHQYLDEYRNRAREMHISIAENKFYGYVYDGIWAIALALNRVDTLLKHYSRLALEGKVTLRRELESIHSLLDFEYHQPIWVKLIREALNKTRFEGVTGTVSFHKNERPGLITFSQFQAFRDMNEVIIGSYDALKDQLDLSVGFPIIWRGSLPPIDYTIQRVTPFRINRTLFVIISVLALLGIVLACVFLFVNIKFRNQRYIKMSSPYLNNLIIIGCILTFTSVIILGLDSGLTSELNFPYICNARAWVLMAGFTLAFGSMFSKTFRVHSIFTNIKLHKKVIKDYKLFMVVFILLTFDICILIVWQYFDPFYRETNNGTQLQDPDNEDVIIVPEMEHCQSKRMTIFLSVIYVYKGLLMAFGCFLAWETRHVSIPALNDSKYIGLSVYNVVIMCVIGASLSFILRDQQDASFVIISIFIIFCSTTTLCLVFVPKVRMLIELKQNPRASDHRVRATLKTFKKNYHEEALGAAVGCRDIHGNIIGRAYGMNVNDRIKILAEENMKHRSSLKEKTYELEALTSKYRKIQSMVQSGQFLQALTTSAVAGVGSQISMGHVAPVATGGSASHFLTTTPSFKAKPATTSCTGSMLLNTGPASSAILHQQSTGGSSSGPGEPTTAILLTSRSMEREACDRVSFSSPSPVDKSRALPASSSFVDAPNKESSQFNQQRQKQAQPTGQPGMRSSPVMSSATQLTTTNTTSSTNNTTDLTTDYSSSKLISTATTSSGLGERVHEISRQVAANSSALRRDIPLKPTFVSATEQRGRIGAQQAFSGAPDGKSVAEIMHARPGSFLRSDEDLNLFSILSYVNSTGGKRNDSQPPARGYSREQELSSWLEGPFCTVMLRQASLDDWRRRQVMGSFSTSVRKQASQQNNASLPVAPTKQLLKQNVRQRLPRTLSMIEYLGLNDIDLIARRHDKILRHKRHMSLFERCISCDCCLGNPSNRLAPYARRARFWTSSGKDLAGAASSSEPINSDELLQSNSLISCSTCCSFATQSYDSHSNIFDDQLGGERSSERDHVHGATSSSSQTISSSASQSSSIVIGGEMRRSPHLGHHHHYEHSHHHGRSLFSSQSNSGGSLSLSQSSLVINQANSCPHHGNQHQSHIMPKLQNQSDRHMQTCSTRNTHQMTQDLGDRSLCTTGVFYGPPGSNEGANNAAQSLNRAPVSTSCEPTSGSSSAAAGDLNTLTDEQTMSDGGALEAPRSADIHIKCDIVENL